MHHAGRKGDIHPFRFSGLSDLSGSDVLMLRLQLFLEQCLKKRHVYVSLS